MDDVKTPHDGTGRARSRLIDCVVLGAVLGLVVGLVTCVAAVILIPAILGNGPGIAGTVVVSAFVSMPLVAAACWLLAYETYLIFRFRPGSPSALATSVLVPYATLSLAISAGGERAVGAACFAFGAVLATAGYLGMRRACKHALGPCRAGIGTLCAHCRHDLSATADHQPCPECGGIMRYEHPAPS